jgi:hypothetical protein
MHEMVLGRLRPGALGERMRTTQTMFSKSRDKHPRLRSHRRLGWSVGLAIWLALILSGCSHVYPAQYLSEDASPTSLCFSATGHTIKGNFLRYFEAMGGLESLGYPITEAFEQEGRRVQYFEYARLEDHPDNPGQPVVKLSMLGERLGRRQPPLRPSRVPPASSQKSRYYPETGHALSGDFLAYFDAHGGLDRFGFPIAEPLVAGGSLVQDFQRARLMWQPHPSSGQRVALEPSGRVYFEVQRLDPALLAASPCPPAQGSDQGPLKE